MITPFAARENRAKICIVTPGAIGSNPRVVKEADALHAAGHKVTVIATRTLNAVEPRDVALMDRVKWDLNRLDLRSRSQWRKRRLRQLAARRIYEATRWPLLAAPGFSPFTNALVGEVMRTVADLYIAHYPAALPVAAAAVRRHGGVYAYDAEDLHFGDWPDLPIYNLDRRLVRDIEGRYLPGCVHVTAASPEIADGYVETYGITRPTVILNVFPLSQGPNAATTKGTAQPGPSVYWFSQTIGPDRGIECAVRAIAVARTMPHLYLRGTLAKGYAKQLDHLTTEQGVADRVHLLAPAAPEDMVRLAATYDVGLVGETGYTASRRVCLTNKLFSFLVAGTPPVISETPAQRAFAENVGLSDQLYPINDAMALARLLDRLLGSPELLAAARARSFQLARETYNWEREQLLLTRTVTGSLATRSIRPSSS